MVFSASIDEVVKLLPGEPTPIPPSFTGCASRRGWRSAGMGFSAIHEGEPAVRHDAEHGTDLLSHTERPNGSSVIDHNNLRSRSRHKQSPRTPSDVLFDFSHFCHRAESRVTAAVVTHHESPQPHHLPLVHSPPVSIPPVNQSPLN